MHVWTCMPVASYIANYRCDVCLKSVPYHQVKSAYAPAMWAPEKLICENRISYLKNLSISNRKLLNFNNTVADGKPIYFVFNLTNLKYLLLHGPFIQIQQWTLRHFPQTTIIEYKCCDLAILYQLYPDALPDGWVELFSLHPTIHTIATSCFNELKLVVQYCKLLIVVSRVGAYYLE